MLSALVICIALFPIRGLYLHATVAHHELIGVKHGWLRTQLWRRAVLFHRRDEAGYWNPPTPRESRVLLVRLAGVPVWRQVETTGLPIGSRSAASAWRG